MDDVIIGIVGAIINFLGFVCVAGWAYDMGRHRGEKHSRATYFAAWLLWALSIALLWI